MFGAIFKTLGSLVIVFLFFSLVLVKNATNEGGEAVEDDNVEDDLTEENRVYPPHMWKGVALWLGIIYAFVNLISIAIAF